MIRSEYTFPYGFHLMVDPLIGVETTSGHLIRRLIHDQHLYLARTRDNRECLVDIRYMHFYLNDYDSSSGSLEEFAEIYLKDFLCDRGLPNIYRR